MANGGVHTSAFLRRVQELLECMGCCCWLAGKPGGAVTADLQVSTVAASQYKYSSICITDSNVAEVGGVLVADVQRL